MAETTSVPLPVDSKATLRGWLVVALLCVVGCLNYLDRTMITTMRESIVTAMPMTDAQFGLLTSVFLWVYGILSPVAGYLADRFNRSRVIIGSLFVWSAVTWLTSYATTFEELLATRALMGISEACYMPAALALIVDYHRGSTRSLATGIHIAGVMAGQSLGFVGGMLAESHDWSFPFHILGLIGIGYSAVLFFFLKDSPQAANKVTSVSTVQKVSFGDGVKNLFSRPAFVWVLVCWGLLGVVSWMIAGWLPTYYKEHFNLSQTAAGLYATGYFYPVSMVGVLIGGALADYWNRSNPRARILLPALGLLVATPAIFLASSTTVLYLAIACFMVYALTRPFLDANMMPILCLVADPRYRATGYGVLNLFSCIIGGLGIYAGGALRDAQIDLSLIFQVAGAMMLVCTYILYRIRPKPEAL